MPARIVCPDRVSQGYLVTLPDLCVFRRSRAVRRWLDRLISLDFDADLEYEETAAGILVPIRLIHGDRSVELRARLDTGAADCLDPSRCERQLR